MNGGQQLCRVPAHSDGKDRISVNEQPFRVADFPVGWALAQCSQSFRDSWPSGLGLRVTELDANLAHDHCEKQG
jgi:hypothetical protein